MPRELARRADAVPATSVIAAAIGAAAFGAIAVGALALAGAAIRALNASNKIGSVVERAGMISPWVDCSSAVG